MLQVEVASEKASKGLWAGIPELKKSTINPTQGQDAALQNNSVT